MNNNYSAFSVFGIEIEFMIVDQQSLDIKPIADQLIHEMAGEITNEFDVGALSISNELALHVIELKTNGPKKTIAEVSNDFAELVQRINQTLEKMDAMLLPTGMHPWYTPTQDFKLWPHGDRKIYRAYHQIFNCRGHGWANLQSTHLNLPFASEKEFVELHSVIRLLLPFIPALTASTPFVEGKHKDFLDNRLVFYGRNQQRIPSIAGSIIPEFIDSYQNYHELILEPMYRDIDPYDQENILCHEWLNSRAAIARFDRNAIEIRIIDTQECTMADLACAHFISTVLQHLMETSNLAVSEPIPATVLQQQYNTCIKYGMNAEIVDSAIINQLPCRNDYAGNTESMWKLLYKLVENKINPIFKPSIEVILNEGNLSTRILTATGDTPNKAKLTDIYKTLSLCLNENRQLSYEKTNHSIM